MNLGLSHLRARQMEPYPSPHLGRRLFDYLMYGVGIIQPVALLPQIISIYFDGQTNGVSVSTWLLLTFFNCLWAAYGVVHKDRLIAVANLLLVILDITIVFGVLYR